MGYIEKFPVGTKIRVKSTEFLGEFRRTWNWHDPLSEQQLQFGGYEDVVHRVGFYHGGDVMYWLEKTPGTWHEDCLETAETIETK